MRKTRSLILHIPYTLRYPTDTSSIFLGAIVLELRKQQQTPLVGAGEAVEATGAVGATGARSEGSAGSAGGAREDSLKGFTVSVFESAGTPEQIRDLSVNTGTGTDTDTGTALSISIGILCSVATCYGLHG